MTITAWYMDSSDADQREPHKQDPNVPCSLDKIASLGVLHWSGRCRYALPSSLLLPHVLLRLARLRQLIPTRDILTLALLAVSSKLDLT